MLSDPSRCQVLLVTTPEETPVSETIETAQLLEEKAGTTLGGVVVNGLLPVLGLPPVIEPAELGKLSKSAGVRLSSEELASLTAAGELRRRRQESQAAQVARLAVELPLAQLELPFCFSSELGPNELEQLTDAFSRRPSPAWSGQPMSEAGAEVVVCVGPGGVGKTTTAAAIALRGARAGSACVRGHDRPGAPVGRRPRHQRCGQRAPQGGPPGRRRTLARASCGP